jgi:FtsP/CotA-like multicopper oxidase with cupredoxin domain
MTNPPTSFDPSRRRVLLSLGSGTIAALAGCLSGGSSSEQPSSNASDQRSPSPSAQPTSTLSPDERVRLPATTGQVAPVSGRSREAWLYDGTVPGPELRVKEGEVLRATVANELPERTTVHWHDGTSIEIKDGSTCPKEQRFTGTGYRSRTRWTACRG